MRTPSLFVRTCLLLLSLLWSPLGFSADLAIEAEGLLYQAIPQRNRPLFAPVDLITVSNRLFVKLPQAERLLESLIRLNVRTQILSGNSMDSTSSDAALILKQFFLNGAPLDTTKFLFSVITPQAFLDGATGAGHPVLLASREPLKMPDAPRLALPIPLGKMFYYYPSYTDAAQEALRLKNEPSWSVHQAFFPTFEAEWKIYVGNRARIFNAVFKTLGMDDSQLRNFVQGLGSEPLKEVTDGTRFLESRGEPRHAQWQRAENGTINSCLIEDFRDNSRITNTKLDECAALIPETVFAWEGTKKARCLLLAKGEKPFEAEPRFCTTQHLLVANGQTLMVASFAGIEQLSPQEAIQRHMGAGPASFRSMLADPKQNEALVSDLGVACVNAINQISVAGGNLASDRVKSVLRPLKSLNKQTRAFYHWSKNQTLRQLFQIDQLSETEAHRRAVQEKRYAEIFKFLRIRKSDKSAHFWWRVFYVAGDSFSSREYGNNVLVFTLNPEAKLLVYKENQGLWREAVAEVLKRHPSLSACSTSPVTGSTTHSLNTASDLFFVILEDSGVEVVDYPDSGYEYPYYQVLNPSAFTGVRRGNADEVR